MKEFIQYCQKHIKSLSTKGIYTVLLLYYAYKNEATPAWAKRIILGAFAYLLSPIDAIPDFTPILGMTDDLGVLSFGLVTIACYINKEVKAKALNKLNKIFPNAVDESELEEVNKVL